MQFHPIADIFPLMSDADFERLCKDIRQNGLLVEIETYNGLIIDGRNRYQACLETGIEPRFREYLGAPENLLARVISLNLERRHLDESQRGLVAARVANMKRGDSFSQRSDASIEASVSQEEAARIFNVSRSTVQRAAGVLRNCVDEVIEAVEAGDISVNQAAAIGDKIPRTKQIRTIQKGGKTKLISMAQNLRIESTLKKAKSTHDACLLCNHELEPTKDNFVIFLKAIIAKRPKFSRYIEDVIFEIEDNEVALEMQDVYDRVLLAIDAGYQTEKEIFWFINKNAGEMKVDHDTLQHALKVMLKSTIEFVPQGGKQDAARGSRKQLYRRKSEKVSAAFLEAQECGYIDASKSGFAN